MGINFPNTPTEGLIYNAAPGISYIFKGGVWRQAPLKTALPKNYLINPSIQVSQELAFGYSTSSVTMDAYLADQWRAYTQNGATWKGGATQVGGVSPNGNPYSLEYACVTSTSAAASDFMLQALEQLIEGYRSFDVQWGMAKAIPMVARFWAKATAPGVCSFYMADNNWNYSYVKNISLTTSFQKFEFAIPVPPLSNVWTVGSHFANMIYGFGGACGNRMRGVEGWNSTTAYGTAANSYWGSDSLNASLYFTDLGLYADPYATGVAPPFEVPSIPHEIRRCQRYWYKAFGLQGGIASATVASRSGMRHPTPMRNAPTASPRGSPRCYDGATTAIINQISANYSNAYAAEFDLTMSAGAFATGGKQASMYYQSDNDYIAVSARMS